MSKPRIAITFWAVSLLSILWVASAQAQIGDRGWSEPYRLSSEAGKASEGYLAADLYGNVHTFWLETLFADNRSVIKYARFDGGTWTIANDIYITDAAGGVTNVSPFVDQHGILHIAWAEGSSGPAYYTHAPANNALAVQNWAKPIRIDIPARALILRIDSKDVFHIIYTRQVDVPGVYYIRSVDQGKTWSEPVWIDPDILPHHIPDSLNFELDDAGGLHAVWFYGALDQSRPDWIRYVHSLDGGNTWSAPVMIDQVVEESDHYLTSASPRMIVQGQTVHVIWAAGEQPYRHHRFSEDAGQTWSTPKRIFGELQGQAFDGLAVDSVGRVHFLGQIRYPMGIYHAYWEHGQWSPASLVYFIAAQDSAEGIGDHIHAHNTNPIIQAGNQLVLTFADGPADPNRRLFAMNLTLDDATSLEPMPTPTPSAATPVAAPPSNAQLNAPAQPAPAPTPTPTAQLFDPAAAPPLANAPKPDFPIWIAVALNFLIFAAAIVLRSSYKPVAHRRTVVKAQDTVMSDE